MNYKNNEFEELLTTKELCEKFKVTRQSLYKWRINGCPTIVHSGNMVRYKLSDVIDWLSKSNRQKQHIDDEIIKTDMDIGSASAGMKSEGTVEVMDKINKEVMQTSLISEDMKFDGKAEPIKSLKKIHFMINYIEKHCNKRDALLFRFGINSVIKFNELISLRYCDLFDNNGKYREYIRKYNEKTGKTIKTKYMLNSLMKEKIRKYCKYYKLNRNNYLFFSYRSPEKPIDRIQSWRVLSKAAKECGISNFGTISLRKTYAYNIYRITGNLSLVTHLLNQQSSKQTINYLGIKKYNPEIFLTRDPMFQI